MSKEKKLQELIEVLGIKKSFVIIVNQTLETVLTPMMNEMISELDESRDGTEEIMKEVDALKEIYFSKMRSLEEETISYTIELYNKHFTEDEISSIIDFYISPTGKRLVELAPIFQKETLEFSMKQAERIIEETEKEMENK